MASSDRAKHRQTAGRALAQKSGRSREQPRMASSDPAKQSQTAGRALAQKWGRSREQPLWRARTGQSGAAEKGPLSCAVSMARSMRTKQRESAGRVGPQKRDCSRAQPLWRGQGGPNSARLEGEWGRKKRDRCRAQPQWRGEGGPNSARLQGEWCLRKRTARGSSPYGELGPRQTPPDCRESAGAEIRPLKRAAPMASSNRARLQGRRWRRNRAAHASSPYGELGPRQTQPDCRESAGAEIGPLTRAAPMASSDRPDCRESAGAEIGPLTGAAPMVSSDRAKHRGTAERALAQKSAYESSPYGELGSSSTARFQGERWRRNRAAHGSSPI